jgi:hypothetical protein
MRIRIRALVNPGSRMESIRSRYKKKNIPDPVNTILRAVEEGRQQFHREMASIMPDVKLGEKNSRLTEDELNMFITHAYRKVSSRVLPSHLLLCMYCYVTLRFPKQGCGSALI